MKRILGLFIIAAMIVLPGVIQAEAKVTLTFFFRQRPQ